MDILHPVYTLINECQDCYKCVRSCQVKAIRVKNDHATVIPHKCIACGSCVRACPSEAKRVRDDLPKVKNLILGRKRLVASIAPSWTGSFKYNKAEFVAILKALGFAEVSETALGAQEVSAHLAMLLNNAEAPTLMVSSACPVIVDYLRFYHPELVRYLTPVASPALTHAKMLKQLYGEAANVVFIGPCIAKKNEADRYPELLAAALTFEELKIWLKDAELDLPAIKSEPPEDFVPRFANEGVLYPLDGGMNETLRLAGVDPNVQLINISSLEVFSRALQNLNPAQLPGKIFIEALACEGGCIAGPCIGKARSTIGAISSVLTNVKSRVSRVPVASTVVEILYTPQAVVQDNYPQEALTETLKKLGKHSAEDELNCGGCGYSTCRELAVALLAGNAESSMCVSYMRTLAVRKAAALLRCMPSAMVMVDSKLKIVEANEAFMRMFLGSSYEIFAARSEGLIGASLDKVVDFTELFQTVLKSNKEVHKEHYQYRKALYDINIFVVEPQECVGAIITDVTQSEMNREKIAKKAQKVISNNIAIVQEIACLLGEHIVETETLLNSIANDYEGPGEG